jgi:hypothetical protein
MAVSQSKINDRYQRALSCLDAEFTDLPADSGGKEAADGLRAAFAVIQSKTVAQSSSSGTAKAGTGERSTARFNVREYRKKLAKTANIISRKKPGFNSNFSSPHGETDEEIITETRAIVPKAVDNKADFMHRGLTLEYLQSGTDLVNVFEATFSITNQALSHRGAATGSKSSAYKDADEFFDELDIYIRNRYADQSDKINAWNNATHIERTAEKKEEEEKG